jgi:hypothetical protein
MKYYTYVYPGDGMEPIYTTLSEEDIIAQYWDTWYIQMCKKFGEEYVKKYFCQYDCIDDWVTIHWAWESE